MSVPLSRETDRTSIAAGAASARMANARKSGKSWMGAQERSEKTFLDAGACGVNPQVAQATVRCVTRFATSMCVVIAVVKIGVYWVSKAAAVKTSAIDSLGDLVANCITLYTGYRMNTPDPVNFPVGQARFEPIGVLVFSTLMASAMLTNALSNVEDLLDEGEREREEAINLFFKAMFGDKGKDKDDNVEFTNVEENFNKAAKMIEDSNLKVKELPGSVFNKIFDKDISYDDKKDEYSFDTAWNNLAEEEDENKLSLVWECSDEDTVIDQEWKVKFTMSFLGCCAIYKFCLWQYCVQIAIPKSASSILVALASDKRNDCVATSFVITVMLFAWLGKKNEWFSEETAEKFDPASSFILSMVIVYTWVSLMIPQMVILGGKTVEPEILEPLCGDVQEIVRSSAVDVNTVKCYKSSAQHTVEVELAVPDQMVPYTKIDPVVKTLYSKLSDLEDIERVLIVMPSR